MERKNRPIEETVQVLRGTLQYRRSGDSPRLELDHEIDSEQVGPAFVAAPSVSSATDLPVALLGTGVCLGGRQVNAEEIDRRADLRRGWTIKHTGVATRYFVDESETAAVLGARAARSALQSAGLELSDIDGIVCGSGTMQQPIPCTAALIQKELGSEAAGLAAFDVNSTCLSFVVGLDNAACLMAAGRYRRLLVISSDVASPGLNWKEPKSAGLMGDGAAAIVLGRSEEVRRSSNAAEGAGTFANGAIHFAQIRTYAEGAELAEIRGGGSCLPATRYDGNNRSDFAFSMNGTGLLRMAMERLPAFRDEFFARSGISWDDVDLVIPHQASVPALRITRKWLGIPKSKWFVNVDRVGNTVAAAIPIAVHQAIETGVMRRGMKVLLMGTSAGFSMGALLFTY